MFGLGKSSTKAESSPKTKKKSSAEFPWKQWMLNHVEKVGMAIFLIFTGYIVYNGLTAKSYQNPKTPDDLQNETRTVQTEIESGNHWNQIKDKRPKPDDFVVKVVEARKPMEATPYYTYNIPERGATISGEKRGDPEVYAPIAIQGSSFFGAIAVNSPVPSPADALLNAPPVGDGKRARKPPTSSTPARVLSQIYDLGFQYKPGAVVAPSTTVAPSARPPVRLPAKPVENKVVAATKFFNVITAAVPHEKIADSFRKEFASATDYRPDGRDTPNYIDYEVQRVDVTANPDSTDWQDAKSCNFEAQQKEKSSWAGTCEEVSNVNYLVSDVFTMSIPPILLADYRTLASHPLIPRHDVERTNAVESNVASDQSLERGNPTSDMSDSRRNPGDMQELGGQSNSADAEDPKNIPKALEMTEYKLLRFVDFNVERGRTYRYRVRLALEDPNYTRSKSFSPRTADMKPETVARVQAKEAAEKEALSNLQPGAKFVRNSKLITEWSEASLPITTNRPIELYSSQATRPMTEMKAPSEKSTVMVEMMPAKATIVYAEWAQDLAMLIPRKTEVQRGQLLSGIPMLANNAGPDSGLDAIHPITKVIKWIAVFSAASNPNGFKFNEPVSIVDIRGGLPLAAEKGRERDKDKLPSGGEVVAYDPGTGELVISREFESTTQFQMLGFTNEKTAEGASSP